MVEVDALVTMKANSVGGEILWQLDDQVETSRQLLQGRWMFLDGNH